MCEYKSQVLHANTRPPLAASPTAGSAVVISSPTATPSAATPPINIIDQPLNMFHVELFHNLYTATLATFNPEGTFRWLSHTVGQSITTPYLANEMLAFSALHLSITMPHKRDFYHYHATQLQTQAVAIFKETNPALTHATSIPLFLFSATLGIHMLCDSLNYRRENFIEFLHQFAHYIRLHHGFRTIIREAWFILRSNPILQPMFEDGIAIYEREGLPEPGCEKLLRLVTAAKLGPDLTETYRHCIMSLQKCINVTKYRTADMGGFNGVMTWPILIEVRFSELLEQRRPEALVILAHFAVLLHRFRDSWLFGDSGRFLIVEITQYLGKEWEEWLTWPNELLREYT